MLPLISTCHSVIMSTFTMNYLTSTLLSSPCFNTRVSVMFSLHLHHFHLRSSCVDCIHFRGSSVFTFAFVVAVYTIQHRSLPRECLHGCSSSLPNVFSWSQIIVRTCWGSFCFPSTDAVCSLSHTSEIFSRFNILNIYMDLNVLMGSVSILLSWEAFNPWERKKSCSQKEKHKQKQTRKQAIWSLSTVQFPDGWSHFLCSIPSFCSSGSRPQKCGCSCAKGHWTRWTDLIQRQTKVEREGFCKNWVDFWQNSKREKKTFLTTSLLTASSAVSTSGINS